MIPQYQKNERTQEHEPNKLPGGSILYVGEEGSPTPLTQFSFLQFILRLFCNLRIWRKSKRKLLRMSRYKQELLFQTCSENIYCKNIFNDKQ